MINIICSYKIIPKKETKVLIKYLKEIKTIYDAWSIMWFPDEDIKTQNIVETELLKQQYKILNKIFRYYYSKYKIDVRNIPDEYYEARIEKICYEIKSWEK